jgi:osmotically-inducible protein OsmY
MNQHLKQATLLVLVVATLILGPGLSGCASYYRDSPNRTAGEVTDDLGIQTAVKTKLIRHGETRGWRINVDVRQGVVSLTGYVHSEQEHQTALEMARNTKGVKIVDDKLQVIPPLER